MFGVCFFLCVMSGNEFDVELCMNFEWCLENECKFMYEFGMMSGCIIQFG